MAKAECRDLFGDCKQCSKCAAEKPEAAFYFDRRRDRFTTECKVCTNDRIRRQRQDPDVAERKQAYFKEYRKRNRQRMVDYMRRYLADPERRARYKAYHDEHNALPKSKAARQAYGRTERARAKSRARNCTPEAMEQQRIRFRSPEARAKQKAYRRRPEIAERLRRWYRSEKGRAKAALCQARKRRYPANFRATDIRFALRYWGDACAVCRKPFKGIKWCLDHWVPLADPSCPGTVPSNMVPLCGHCNSTKHSAPAAVWLRREYPGIADSAEESVRLFFSKVRSYDHDRATRHPIGQP